MLVCRKWYVILIVGCGIGVAVGLLVGRYVLTPTLKERDIARVYYAATPEEAQARATELFDISSEIQLLLLGACGDWSMAESRFGKPVPRANKEAIMWAYRSSSVFGEAVPSLVEPIAGSDMKKEFMTALEDWYFNWWAGGRRMMAHIINKGSDSELRARKRRLLILSLWGTDGLDEYAEMSDEDLRAAALREIELQKTILQNGEALGYMAAPVE